MKYLVLMALMFPTMAIAQPAPSTSSMAASQMTPKKLILELDEQQAQALVALMDDGVKSAGLAKAETAAILYNLIRHAAQQAAQPKAEEKERADSQ